MLLLEIRVKAEEPQIMTYGEMPPDPSYLMSDNVNPDFE